MCTSVFSLFQTSSSAPTTLALDKEGQRRNSSSAHLRANRFGVGVTGEEPEPLTDSPVGGNGEAAEGSQEEEERESGGESGFHLSWAFVLEC